MLDDSETLSPHERGKIRDAHNFWQVKQGFQGSFIIKNEIIGQHLFLIPPHGDSKQAQIHILNFQRTSVIVGEGDQSWFAPCL